MSKQRKGRDNENYKDPEHYILPSEFNKDPKLITKKSEKEMPTVLFTLNI